jgi:phage terminase large subunit-like protein
MDDLRIGAQRGLTFDKASAQRALNFFPDVLRLAQGKFEGAPFRLHPSQAFIIGSLFGWKGADGARRFRRAYIEQAKGQGKSPLAAGIGMYCLLADGEAQAEIYAGASMKSQAMVVFRAAINMWRQSPALFGRLTPSGGNPVWNLADIKTGSFFRPISTEEAHSGPMPSCALLDELHEHRSGHMVEMMERGFKSRRQPLLIMITNSGSDRQSVCWQEHQHAARVAAGTMNLDDEFTYVGEAIDDTAFSYVCAIDKTDNFLEDENCWVKANPMLGVTMPVEELRRAVAQAKAIPGKLNNVLRLHGCVWTESDTAWMSRPALEAVLSEFEPETEHTGERVFCGLDLSATQDLTALAFVVPTGFVDMPGEDGTTARLPTFDAWVEAWTPGDTLAERALRDNVPYDLWVKDGFLNAAPGRMVRFDFVAARLAELVGLYEIAAVAYDSYGFKRHFEPELDSLGVTLPIVEHPQGGKKKGAQGLWMPGSKLILEQLILEKRIRLRRSPVLISAMMSATTENDPFGNFWFSKRKAVNRIDALVALAMAVGAATAQAEAHSYLETSEMVVL